MSKFKVTPPNDSKVQKLISLARSVEVAIDNGKSCDNLLAEISLVSECNLYDKDYFSNLYKHSSVEEFAAQAAYSPPKKIPNISRNDLVEILELAQDNLVDPSLEYYLKLFDANVVMPGASNLLFHLPEDWPYSSDDPTADEIVDYVLSYKIISL